MARPSPRKSPARRGTVSRELALTRAVAIADADGIDAVTMRRLATDLGIEAMSLYHHVANKDAVLDGMVDVVFAEIVLPPTDEPWKRAMTVRAESVREVLLRHRWAIAVLESRASPGPALLRHHDAVIGCCRAAGFSVEMTAHAFSLIDSYVFGFVLQEVNLPFDGAADLDAAVTEMMPAGAAELYPHLTELTAEFILRPGYSYADEFAFGLDLVLTGLEATAR